MIVADIHGSVHVCNIDLETVRTFVAHPDNGRVTHAKFAAGKGILVTLGVRHRLFRAREVPSVDVLLIELM